VDHLKDDCQVGAGLIRWEKRSSLYSLIVTDKVKSFITLTTGLNIIKPFFVTDAQNK